MSRAEIKVGQVMDVDRMTKAQCVAWVAGRGLFVAQEMVGDRQGRRFWASDDRGRVGPQLSTGRHAAERLRAGDYRRLIAALAEANIRREAAQEVMLT